MLTVVQSIQISRNQTTYENMRGSHAHQSTLTTAITTGSFEGMDGAGAGPNPATLTAGGLPAPATARNAAGKKKSGGCCTSLSTLIGLDTFIKTARGTRAHAHRRRARNPWNLGIIRNCRDFWCDGLPYFGDRGRKAHSFPSADGLLGKAEGEDGAGSVGVGMLGGQRVDWTRLWDVPREGRIGVNSGMVYARLVREGQDGGEEDDEDEEDSGRGGRGDGLLAGGGGSA